MIGLIMRFTLAPSRRQSENDLRGFYWTRLFSNPGQRPDRGFQDVYLASTSQICAKKTQFGTSCGKAKVSISYPWRYRAPTLSCLLYCMNAGWSGRDMHKTFLAAQASAHVHAACKLSTAMFKETVDVKYKELNRMKAVSKPANKTNGTQE